MATHYAWRRKRLHGDLDAQIAGEHMEELVEKYDEHLTAEEILADARKTSSPLHEAFEWDENAAAEKHRLRTAKLIITSLVIKRPAKSKVKKVTRAFVFVKVAKHGRKCYIPVRSAMAQPELASQVVEQAYKQLTQWVGAYGGSRALRSVSRDVERLRRKIEVEFLTAAGIL